MKLSVCIAGLGLAASLASGDALGDFSYSQYTPGDLDQLLAQRSGPVAPLPRPERRSFNVTLLAAPEDCDAAILKVATPQAEQGRVSRCVTVKTEKGSTARLFVQDNVADDLKAFPPGTKLTIYADQLLRAPAASGLVVRESMTRSR